MKSRTPLIVYTRDAVVPMSADDLEMENGCTCVPIPPDDSGDWIIWDSISKDYKTGWIRKLAQWGHA
jgi:hypothetical protein